MPRCTATYNVAMGFGGGKVVCERFIHPRDEEHGHPGRHYGWEEREAYEGKDIRGLEISIPAWRCLWTWSSGGAHGRNQEDSANVAECSMCMTLEAAKGLDDLGHCFYCRLWAERAKEYAQPNSSWYVRPHDDEGPMPGPWLYSWSVKGVSGGFGDRPFKVEWDNGTKVGPASQLWGGGEIPWEWLPEFPPNGKIIAVDKYDPMRRAAHIN
jgi:hypothetical protein